jgi:hypothetical protein
MHGLQSPPCGDPGGTPGSTFHTPRPPCLFSLPPSGDFILVGDLMKSLTLLMYKAAEGSLEVRARDLDSKWLTALAALDDDTYAVADNCHNLVCGPESLSGVRPRSAGLRISSSECKGEAPDVPFAWSPTLGPAAVAGRPPTMPL